MKKMALVDIAIEVLRESHEKSMTLSELLAAIMASGKWQSKGKTPMKTLRERIGTNIRRGQSPFVKHENGKISLHHIWGSRQRLLASEKQGYVYAITNRSFALASNGKTWVKIGHAGLDVGRRLFIMQSGVPYNFDVNLLMRTIAPGKVESELHKTFKEYNLDAESDEYFAVDIALVKEEMERLSRARTYRGAKIYSSEDQNDEIKRIIQDSKLNPTLRGRKKGKKRSGTSAQ